MAAASRLQSVTWIDVEWIRFSALFRFAGGKFRRIITELFTKGMTHSGSKST
jgi:hypothetical protein